MASKSHTPGPWSVKALDKNEGKPNSHRTVSVYAGIKFIADCRCGFNFYKPLAAYPEEMQNARLIAAAPELLAALKSLMGTFRGGLAKPAEVAKFDAARAAIAKAEGMQ